MAIPSIKMNSGAEIPQIGFGLWQVRDERECVQSVKWALEAGYRHFDDAQVYGNEQYLGEALKASNVPREQLFITTKIASNRGGTSNQIPDRLIPSFEESLKKLQMDYVDLLLLHFPLPDTRQAAWPLMEEIFKSGKAKAIGVSNYMVNHLEELLKDCKVKPAANQIELSVGLQMAEVVQYCKDNDIVVEAYTPLAEGRLFNDPVLKAIAEKHHKSVPQIMLRWCVDYGTVPLVKSVHEDRIKSNLEIFDFKLDNDDLAKIKALDQNMRNNWNPTNVA